METDKQNLGINYIYNHLKGHDMISLPLLIDLLDEINNHNFSISLDPQNSWSKKMELSFSYNRTGYTQKSGPTNPHQNETHKGPSLENEKSYQIELLKNVVVNIKDAQTNSIQMKMGFKGLYETEYELIVASSNSYTSNITRILAFMKNSTTIPMEPRTYMVRFYFCCC